MSPAERPDHDPPRFDRRFLEGAERFTVMGAGALGGKASGLQRARDVLASWPGARADGRLEIAVPTLTVIGTDAFDAFVAHNRLRDLVREEPDDHHVARAFQAGELPPGMAGDLWDLVREVRTPLAVRSSSLLEDALAHPFAGVYATKMTPNEALDPQVRFRRLVEAIRLVWASTCFRGARAAVRAAGHDPDAEKMAVIVQEVVGRRHGPRFYPDVSGVARSYHFYPSGDARPEDGVVSLALGLGRTIVDGGRAWTYSPAAPHSVPPFNSPRHMLEETQTRFWAVNMGAPPAFDPTTEAEFLVHASLTDAEEDGTLPPLVSTWEPGRDRFVMGAAERGARVLDFAPLLRGGDPAFNDAVRGLLDEFRARLGEPVEIEFALTFPDAPGRPARLGFLQVRPLAVSAETVDLPAGAEDAPGVLVASGRALGNGVVGGLRDVVFVKRESFDIRHSRAIADELEGVDHALSAAGRPYVLMGFGRWGSSDPWLGIPVTWSQIAGARVIVEATTPGLNAELSQGAHFFHNLLGFGIVYLCVPAVGAARLDWDAIEALPREHDGRWIAHARAPVALTARVDGRTGRGVLARDPGGTT